MLHPYLRHLRLGFNLLLSPIYLWGVLLAGGSAAGARFWLGYLSLHLFLYGGTTAFNSYFDRDEGPVGGMLHPPPVDRGLLRFSLLVQVIGLVPALLVGVEFALAWLLLFAIFTAYSHPSVRLKSRPEAAIAAIAVGQGALGFALGWLTAASAGGLWSRSGAVGMASTALVVTGLYLVSQAYQARDDAARGDRTLAVLLGSRRALVIALLPLSLGGSLLVFWLSGIAPWWLTISLSSFFVVLGVWVVRWAARFDERRVEENFGTAMRFMTVASVGLSLSLLLQLVLR